jgi:beta-lactamase superfamily II metal-dependent hydrolase
MRRLARGLFWFGFCAFVSFSAPTSARADLRDGRLDIYFIDVEGGAATLFVTPAGESLLIDSGFPDNGGRDRDRILKVARDVAGLKQIDHAAVTHWHIDHFGNHAALSTQIPIKQYWDRGIPAELNNDARIGEYRSATQNQSKTLKAGDTLPLKAGDTPLNVQIVTASGETIPNGGAANPFAADNKPMPVDTSDNALSLSFLLTFGKFSFLCCGDLTWNVEAKLVTPNNPLGTIEMFMVTRHGLNQSNNPTLVKAIAPHVAVMCNGPRKGGDLQTMKMLKEVPSLAAAYQLHRSLAVGADDQTPAEFIANDGTTEECKGEYVKASIAPGGESYTVQIGPKGEPRTYKVRVPR